MRDAESGLWAGWREASARAEVDVALRGLYAELDATIAAKGPTCWSSGKCCKFVEFEHRLYVTGLEIAWFLGGVTAAEGDAETNEPCGGIRLPQFAEHPGACPYQIDGLCSTHAIRPLGCRIFFCQQGTEAWQQDVYEDFLGRLQSLHQAHGIEYRYMDWIAGLEQAGA
ncbi:hypothetical protein [Algisphaera agarilytica]|uniref:Fe-S-cluster containining protein n=1 Tax=Algisphaera agarilytica TaxID=1385975 RepID=A0A7X0LIU3_9BACT|nr:hypothetical protein [Algisphaera agarilytica]MBB6428610.1 Fe-S-cluster containining protein [Algisphaera agarilytica]